MHFLNYVAVFQKGFCLASCAIGGCRARRILLVGGGLGESNSGVPVFFGGRFKVVCSHNLNYLQFHIE